MSLFPPPRLARSYATTPEDFVARRREAADAILRQVKTAYSNLPFKGQPLVLPGGIEVADDLWRCELEDLLENLDETELKAFSLEEWLTAKVDAEGTPSQRDDLRKLLRSLDDHYDMEDDFHYGLPTDIMSVVHQPLTEIEVYRDLPDIDIDDDDDDDDNDAEK
ncbi:hypothetical protein CTAYLR_002784 [Chrysophaeum taylorii]|uniref:Uncharacterized protein n=1 Tax=Chrysophaeum taylorii TaxID=2483200 RepID=A0AAD7UC04_9STRA|nr:hypothetical protein CTAYLR_002784 [Chrysophaeum taylorii]